MIADIVSQIELSKFKNILYTKIKNYYPNQDQIYYLDSKMTSNTIIKAIRIYLFGLFEKQIIVLQV